MSFPFFGNLRNFLIISTKENILKQIKQAVF